MAGNVNFDAILSTTLKNYRDTLENNVSTNVALWKFLSDRGNIRTEPGGASFVVPIIHGKNSTSKSYAGYDTLDTTAQAGITAAEYPWRQHGVTVAISGIERAQNSGPQQVINLMKAKTQQAELTTAEDFETMFYGDGTGNTNKDFFGLGLLVGNEASTITSVGGIDCATTGNEFWRSYVNTTAGALTLADMNLAYRKAVRGNSMPDFGVTTLDLYNKYESLLTPQLRFSDPKMAEAGFQNLKFQGSTFVYSDAAPAGVVYFLNSTYVQIVRHDSTWLTPTAFEQPWNQDAWYSKILSYGNLVISNRKLGGAKLTARTV